ncbi:MAG: Crp/Fnr family transcriptional regulator [Thermoleophilaceae bacterium]|nr:Crp/Fnr family transcriptional regulator [Thermoleophilaceae bacterium]
MARSLPPAEARAACRLAAASVVSLPKGVFWPHEHFLDESGTLGMLLLDGLLLRGLAVTDRPTVEVLGPGDVFLPFDLERDPDASVSGEVRWWALRPARTAVLDASFTRRMSGYPEVIAELAGRLSRRSAVSSLRLAIAQEPQLSVRLHWTLWQLAERFGEVQAEGMWLRAPLCHSLLSWLVGARRPAMSRAINELERSGRLARCPDGTWWLGRQRPEGLGELALPAQPVAA